MALKGDKGTTSFGAPVVAPGVRVEPAAQKYLHQRGAGAPAPMPFSMPVGGGPPPAIPPLTQKPTQDGLAMADYATQRIQPQLSPEHLAALGQHPGTSSFVQPKGVMPPLGMPQFRPMAQQPPAPSAAQQPQAPSAGPPFGQFTNGIQQNDLLPSRAKEDSDFQHGMGSDLAVNQPMLAFRHGVIRNGSFIPPQQLSSGRPGMSKEAVDGVATIMQFHEQAKRVESGETLQEAEARQTAVGAAAQIGTPKKVEEPKASALDALDDFDWMRLRDVMNDILSNEGQRKIVEARCKPLRLEDMLMTGSVQQDVPIVIDLRTGAPKFQPTFRSVSTQQNLSLKIMLMKEAKALDLRGAYFDDKFGIMGACASVTAINGYPLPDDHNEEGNFIEELFWNKFNYFVKFSLHMVGSLGVHAFWFDMRVRRLFVAEEVKNG